MYAFSRLLEMRCLKAAAQGLRQDILNACPYCEAKHCQAGTYGTHDSHVCRKLSDLHERWS